MKLAPVCRIALVAQCLVSLAASCGEDSTSVENRGRLAFTVQPSQHEGAQPITPAVEVTIQDGSGDQVPTATDAVSLAIGPNPAGGTLTGTTTVTANGGVARFADLRIDRPGTGYTFVASGTGLVGATSAPFAIRLTFAQISAGGHTSGGHTCAVTTAGATYCWGYNEYGQLGDGTTSTRTTPVLVVGGLRFAQVSAGDIYHTCAVTTSGAAYCWGANDAGQLGDGTTIHRTSPVPVVGGLTFAQLSAGFGETCGVASGGAAYCWGHAYPTDRTSPVLVEGGLSFAQVSSGGGFSCGVTTGSAGYCWGTNEYGQLGDSTTTYSPRPVPVIGGASFAEVSAGQYFACGLTTGRAAYCWGLNDHGELGDRTTTARTSPVPVVGGFTFAQMSVGTEHACGVESQGGFGLCWGDNSYGKLGVGNPIIHGWISTSPVRVAGELSFVHMTGGFWHTCGLTAIGQAYCWGGVRYDGTGGSGELGDGTTAGSFVPVRVVQ